MLGWVTGFGVLDKIGMESTGSYSASLTRFLLDAGAEVREVNTPHARTRARKGKTDAIDAEAAARKVLAGDATTRPKTTTGAVESIRLLTVARNSAIKARSAALVQLQDVLVTAPAHLRDQITAKGGHTQATQCAKFRADAIRLDDPAQAAKLTLRSLAKRIHALDDEIVALDAQLEKLVSTTTSPLSPDLGSASGMALSS